MPSTSTHPPVTVPDKDLFSFLFERDHKPTNQIDTPSITWGTLWACGVITPANPAYTAEELTFQLKDSGAKALVTLAELLPTAIKAADAAGISRDRIILLGDQKSPGFKHWRDIFDPSTSVKWRRTKITPDKDIAFLVYSSGTTGLPKGVMLSHRNIVANVVSCLDTARRL
ncbi:hypothetical protein Q9L58_008902 [Maublancomyces gigas]|uniref:AMP-dependent synthetase/ligase domain-containing protein n=1 Tax=Discina gigas TaxID=1032678 RepID=A0ABR3G8X8_9PEZI